MADIDALVESLTLEEKSALTAGEDFFSTVAVERLGIAKVRLTDGPSGAKGLSFPGAGGAATTCIPCASAIGASWDPALAEQLGALVGREARDRGCRVLLAPTVNLHRTPLGGRNFECYSEDPLLSGRLGAAYTRGAQSTGVIATVKHFVGNDAEYERSSVSSEIDERTLREIYLVPFEMVIKDGGALAVMTAYNRVNGRWVTENPELLMDILRKEWGFKGLVMTDWLAVADTVTSLGAGVDLEMPGPGRALGSTIVRAVHDRIVDEADLDAAVRRLLGALDRIGALDGPEPPIAPKPPSNDDRELLRAAAAESMVLLRNDGMLPLAPASLRRVAIVGAHAAAPYVVGGGSAEVVMHPFVTPLEALTQGLGADVEIVHERGCEVTSAPTLVGGPVLRAPQGFEGERYHGTALAGEVVDRRHFVGLRMMVVGSMEGEAFPDAWSMRVRGSIVSEEDGAFEISLVQAGRARLFIDGELLIDGFTNPPPPGGDDFYGQGSEEIVADVHFSRSVPVEVVVEYARVDTRTAGFRVGFRVKDPDVLLERAVGAARSADVALVFAGTTSELEAEGRDRPSFGLPGRQDELIRRVAAVNRRTVVVLNAASPVDMSWEDGTAAVLQCWFGGQEMGPALADVLTGRAEPSGRLPTTIPVRLEHNPSYDNYPGQNGRLVYGENLFMGYRGYEHRSIPPRYPFGHGLGYTTFDFGEPSLSRSSFRPGETITVSVPVTNTGPRAGSEVVQCYVAPIHPRLPRPLKELKAFARVRLEPGDTTAAEFELDDRAFAYWDPGQPDWDAIASRIPPGIYRGPGHDRREPGWQVDSGRYEVLIGRSSQDIRTRCPVEVLRA